MLPRKRGILSLNLHPHYEIYFSAAVTPGKIVDQFILCGSDTDGEMILFLPTHLPDLLCI